MSSRRAGGSSLRVRLLTGSLAWTTAALVVTGAVLAELFANHVEERLIAEMQNHLDQLAGTVAFADDGTPSMAQELSDPRFRKPYSGLYWQIDGATADVRGAARSRSLWDTVLRLPADVLDDGEIHRHVLTGPDGQTLIALERTVHPVALPDLGFRLIVATDRRSMTDPIGEFVKILLLSLGVLALGLGIAAVVQVVAGLSPLSRLREALIAVRDGRTRSIAGAFPTEVQPLVDDLNALLAHDAEVVARARTQAGNLAHALKTPLAVLANAAAREHGDLAGAVGEQVARAQRQIDYHLAGARAAAAVEVPGMRTELAPAIEALARTMRQIHAERAISIDVEVPDDAAFRGEAQDLQEMLGNLMDNACKWASGRVNVAAAREDGQVVIAVEDDGPGLPAELRAAMFARGARADATLPGSGLGLAIVRDLADLYGGGVSLSVSPAGGLRAVLTLPAA